MSTNWEPIGQPTCFKILARELDHALLRTPWDILHEEFSEIWAELPPKTVPTERIHVEGQLYQHRHYSHVYRLTPVK